MIEALGESARLYGALLSRVTGEAPAHAAQYAFERGWRDWLTELLPRYLSDASGRILPFGEHHAAFWDWIWTLRAGTAPAPLVCIWPRGGGKCLNGDVEILRADGTRTAIRDIRPGDAILSLNEQTGAFECDRIVAHWHSGQTPCLAITTRTGKTVQLTGEHRVLTFNGWKQANELTLADRIAAPRRVTVDGEERRDDAEVRLLAYMLAEGTCSNACNFTNADAVIVEDFTHCAEALGFIVKPRARYRHDILVGRANPRAWLRDTGLAGGLATTKRVPAWVYRLPQNQKWQFLAAFIDCDGWIMPDRGRLAITLANRALVEDLMYLFMQVGVVCSVRYKRNAFAGAWTVEVDQDGLRLCADNLPLILKRAKLRAACDIPRYSLLDTYPAEAIRGLPFRASRAVRNHSGTRAGTPYRVTRGKMRRLIAAYPYEKWQWLESADLFWDEIRSVEPAGHCDTYDVEVERNHNLITGGLVTHNSTSAEMAGVMVGAMRSRRYVLYICETLERAEDHVANVAGMLESGAIERYYPHIGNRMVSKFGSVKGWRRNRLRTASGFTVDAIGLDVAARGVKLDDVRPDLMIFDDIDGELDSQATTDRKITTITKKFLPAGSRDLAALFVQNLIQPDSIFSRLAGVSEHRADFLHERIVSGPFPAVHDLTYEEHDGRYTITGGRPIWAGMDLAECESQINRFGLTSFLTESQQEVEVAPGGMFDHVTWRHTTRDALPQILRCIAALDPAVTDTDSSDSHGVQIDALGMDGKMYRLFSWEQRASTERVMALALLKCLEYGATELIVETNQGGDTWRFVYDTLVKQYRETGLELDGARHAYNPRRPVPKFSSVRASSSTGGKAERAARMLVDYEHARIIHVEGTHATLEKALKRFPKVKPFDLVDCAYWGWETLLGSHPPLTGNRTAVGGQRQIVEQYDPR